MIYVIGCVIFVAFIATTLFFVIKGYLSCRRNERLMQSCIIESSILTEMIVKQQVSHLDSLPHNVLCIGNSITLHEPLNDVNWYSSQGMAASKPEYDYCHVLEKYMRKHNSQTTVTPVNFASWERDFAINIDSILREYCVGKDIIIIRIGENVKNVDVSRFADALANLIDYCLRFTDKIILTGVFWPSSEKEHAIVKNAMSYKLKYVPIHWIWDLYNESCTPHEGDIIYDTSGAPYQINGNFITTHPNDLGMELIAKSIYNTL